MLFREQNLNHQIGAQMELRQIVQALFPDHDEAAVIGRLSEIEHVVKNLNGGTKYDRPEFWAQLFPVSHAVDEEFVEYADVFHVSNGGFPESVNTAVWVQLFDVSNDGSLRDRLDDLTPERVAALGKLVMYFDARVSGVRQNFIEMFSGRIFCEYPALLASLG